MYPLYIFLQTMIKYPFKKITHTETILIVIVSIFLVIFSVFLIRKIHSIGQAGIMKNHMPPISKLLIKNKEMNRTSITDISYIEGWMTFAYVNFIFSLPEDYLQKNLLIEDPKYPNLPIYRYIKRNKLNTSEFIEKLKNIVREYMIVHSTK